MPDYKSMYYHLAGRMATAVDILESTTDVLEATTKTLTATSKALVDLKERLKLAQQITEDMFIGCDEDDLNDDPKETT
jgi:hypothetical protein